MPYADLPNLEELQLLMVSLDNEGPEHMSTFFMLAQLPVLQRLFVRLPNHGGSCSSAAALTDYNDDADIMLMFKVVLDQLTFIKAAEDTGMICKKHLQREPLRSLMPAQQYACMGARQLLEPL